MTKGEARAYVRRELGVWLDLVGSQPPAKELPSEVLAVWSSEVKRIAAFLKSAKA